LWERFIHGIPNAFDLLALTTCIGALGCRVWVLQLTDKAMEGLDFESLLTNLWRLLGACIAVLVLSSAVLLSARTAEMSGLPITAILPIVPTVLFKTHYGKIWLIRVVAITVLCIGWWRGKRHLDSLVISVFMVGAGALIAMTRSAAGHAADAGDLSIPELMDWLHLMAVSVWGGGLIVLSTIVFPAVLKLTEQRQMLITDIALRFSTLAGIALGTIVVTATYNAWLQVRSFHALWGTPYGQLVIVKFLLLFALVILGASNRYITVPLLQQLTGRPLIGQRFLNGLLCFLYLNLFQQKPELVRVTRWFMRKVWAEAILVIVVLICTAMLLHETPARQLSHTWHEYRHNMQKSKMEGKRTYYEYAH
jgi:copper resistance protein D